MSSDLTLNNSSSRSTLLVVDDDPDIVQFINQIIKAAPSRTFDVVFAMTGEGAINRINSQKIDALVVDIKLPDITGVTVAKMVKEKFASMPIAFFTNYTGEAIEKECRELNAFYWSKVEVMADPKRLLTCLEGLLKGESCTTNVDSYAQEVSEMLAKRQKIHIRGYLRENRI